jgi:hypothetical protein
LIVNKVKIPEYRSLARLKTICRFERCSMRELADRYTDEELLEWPSVGVKTVKALRKYYPERFPLDFWL